MQKQFVDQLQLITREVVNFLPVLGKALVFLVVGFWLVKRFDRWLKRYFDRKDFDVSLEGFIRSMFNIGLKVLIIVTVSGMVGLPTTSLVAIFGAAGLAVGLALQGSLANFAGGVLILIYKPFRIGDTISSLGETGEVIEIQIFNTILLTAENKTVILPNGALSNGSIVNISRHGNLRVDMKVIIDYREDVENVRKIILNILYSDPKVLKIPPPSVTILEYGEGAITLAVRPFALTGDHAAVFSGSYEKIHAAFLEYGVKSPQPRRVMV